jgi:ABC-type cobalamin/Fe3+-siderophores transport system ATPase subunit
MSVEPALTARSLVKRYGRVTALDHADFDLYPGEILAVIGDNGAGKSTLIKALCGAVIPDSGEIRLGGDVVHFTSPIAAREAGPKTGASRRLADSLETTKSSCSARPRRRSRSCANAIDSGLPPRRRARPICKVSCAPCWRPRLNRAAGSALRSTSIRRVFFESETRCSLP